MFLVKQSRFGSFVESCANVGAGFGLGLAGQVVFLPLLGVPVRLEQNLAFAGIMTAISLSRAFLLRRLFEARRIAGERRDRAPCRTRLTRGGSISTIPGRR